MRDHIALCKPRIALLVVVTALFGFTVAGGERGPLLWWTLLGTGLAACACGALNQWMELVPDALMKRTAGRPLPAGRLSPGEALAFGVLLALAGLAVLSWKSGPLPCAVTAATLFLYVAVYTPLKRVTPHATWVGAAAGATAPLVGWAAAKGALPVQAWVLFFIQFLWQIPHFLALFWMYREDYARAGFKVMPVVDPRGGVTSAQIALHSFSVLPASLLPGFCGMAGPAYSVGALALGAAYLGVGMKASWTMADPDNRRLFRASLAYLPALFGMLLIGGV